MIEEIGKKSIQEGRPRSRLPVFSEKWINSLRGSADFFGLNYYTSRYIDRSPPDTNYPNPSFMRDRNIEVKTKPEWKHGATDWLYSVPEGMGDMLRYDSKHNISSDTKLMNNKFICLQVDQK